VHTAGGWGDFHSDPLIGVLQTSAIKDTEETLTVKRGWDMYFRRPVRFPKTLINELYK